MRRKHILSLVALPLVTASFLLVFGWAPLAVASTTDGTIDATNRYAWSENNGWIDFGTTEGNVHVTDSVLSGYAWSELTGWISLNCSNTTTCATVDYKVTNNSEGTLGGYAWSENIGWIVFNCATTSSCGTTSYTVSTDWRPASSRSSGALSSTPKSVGGGGGGRGVTGPGGRSTRAEVARAALVDRFRTQVASDGTTITPVGSPRSSRPTIVKGPSSSAIQTAARSSFSPERVVSQNRGHLQVTDGLVAVLYKDVPIDAWFAPYVSLLIAEKIAEGYKDENGKATGEFGVENPVTKAEVLKMALEAAGKAPDSQTKTAPQNRTARGTWAAAYVKTAEDLKLTVFVVNPDVNSSATRSEVIQTILEVIGFPIAMTPSTFTDVPADHPYSRAIALAAFNGFVEGDKASDGTLLNRFRPDAPINRAEVAKIVALVREVVSK